MRIRSLLQDSHFQNKKVLEKILCHHTGFNKSDLVIHYDDDIESGTIAKIKYDYDQYTIDKKPLEFIFGYVEFFGRKFRVDERCLIPRPETEYMIEGVNEYVKSFITQNQGDVNNANNRSNSQNIDHHNNTTSATLIDVGTGCGVLGLSVLLENPGFFSQAYLTEYIESTLSLAKENYAQYAHRILTPTTLLQCNLIEFMIDTASINAENHLHTTHEFQDNYVTLLNKPIIGSPIILIANLPYIPDETFDTQVEDNVKKREPRPAFVGGKDGLDYYREMFAQWQSSQYAGTTPITMFLEMMTRQVDILRQEFGHTMIFEEIKTFHFNIRIVKATFLS